MADNVKHPKAVCLKILLFHVQHKCQVKNRFYGYLHTSISLCWDKTEKHEIHKKGCCLS